MCTHTSVKSSCLSIKLVSGKDSFLSVDPGPVQQKRDLHPLVVDGPLPLMDSHQHPRPPSLLPLSRVGTGDILVSRPGRELRKACEIMCTVAPFLGTSLDANRWFYRGPGQGPGTEAEPYLKMTVRCLYLFGSVDRGGRGHLSEVWAILMGPGSGRDKAISVSSTPSWGMWTCLSLESTGAGGKWTQSQSSESSPFTSRATGGMRENHQGNQP